MAKFEEAKETLHWVSTPSDKFTAVIAMSYREEYLENLDEKETAKAWEEFSEQFIAGRAKDRLVGKGALIISSGFAVSETTQDPITDKKHFALVIPATLDLIAEIGAKWNERLNYGVRFVREKDGLLLYPSPKIYEVVDDNSPNSTNPDIILGKFEQIEDRFTEFAEELHEEERRKQREEEERRLEEERRRQAEIEAEENRPLTIEEQLELEQYTKEDLKADLQEELTDNLLATFPERSIEPIQVRSTYIDSVEDERLRDSLLLLVDNLQEEANQQAEEINQTLKLKRLDVINNFRPKLLTDLDESIDNIERHTILRSQAHPEADNQYTRAVEKIEEEYLVNLEKIESKVKEQRQIAEKDYEDKLNEFIEREIKRLKRQFREQNYEQLVDVRVSDFEQDKIQTLDNDFDERVGSIEQQSENSYFEKTETAVSRVFSVNKDWLNNEKNQYRTEIDSLLENHNKKMEQRIENLNDKISNVIIDFNKSKALREDSVLAEVRNRTEEYEHLVREKEALEKLNEERQIDIERYAEQNKAIEEQMKQLNEMVVKMEGTSIRDEERINNALAEYLPEIKDKDGNVISSRSERHMSNIQKELDNFKGVVSEKLKNTSLLTMGITLLTLLTVLFGGWYGINKVNESTTNMMEQQERQFNQQMEKQNERLDTLEDLLLANPDELSIDSLEDLEEGMVVTVEQADEEVEMTVTEITENGRVVVEDEEGNQFELVE